MQVGGSIRVCVACPKVTTQDLWGQAVHGAEPRQPQAKSTPAGPGPPVPGSKEGEPVRSVQGQEVQSWSDSPVGQSWTWSCYRVQK